MPKTHPLSISCETHGLAGNLVLPDSASDATPVPGALIVGGPGPLPLERYTAEGARQWPVTWTEALADAGLAGLCYDQRGSGLSTGLYHDADWKDLYEDAKAAAEMLDVQPEVSKTAAIAWGEGCAFALQLAAQGRVNALVLMAPPFLTAEARYAKGVAELAARRGLSDRVVQLRISQWRNEIEETAKRVEQGQTTATTDLGTGGTTTTNLVRFLQTVIFDPAQVAPHVKVPVLLLHGADDAVIPPAESEAMARALGGPAERIAYPKQAHFLYRSPEAMRDAVLWLKQTLVG